MNLERKYSLEGTIATLLFVALILVILLQILGRTNLVTGPVWTEEVARWLWVWMAFFAIPEVERQNAQLKMGFLAEMLAAKVQAALYLLIDLIYFGIMVHLSFIGYKTILRTWRNESVTLPTSDALLYASAFVASFFVLFRIAQRIWQQVQTFKAKGENQ
ncbi:TRAP transporter small permease [Maritalea mediterranea]|uniref:TRAP transporter small permease protein n=1 Tax=Maritalea mediterranea TaxID=2909667 RepID=A0ABS9E771_9HYPH|nr:TRAP transporter small permease subunit [Maritalea mediterranea]MCF4097278.1 TRAP transporter small permease subunit [Maritalea mediterranea]